MDEVLEGDVDDDNDDDDDDDDYSLDTRDNRVLDISASVASSSFSFGRQRLEALRQQAIIEAKPKALQSQSTDSPMGDDDSEPLAYTVDSYRRQQLYLATPVLRKASRHNDDGFDTSTDSEAGDEENRARDEDHIRSQAEAVDAKIKKLSEVITIQQQQMVQASNALNACASSFAFFGSTESVVAEWKLLIAS